MKKLTQYIISMFLLMIFNINAQETKPCGVTPTIKDFEYRANRTTSFVKSSQAIIKIPVTIHIVRKDNCIGGINENTLNQAIIDLNNFYASATIEFVFCSAINYIDSTEFYSYEEAEEDALAGPTEKLQTLNIYFANEIIKNSNSVCGYAKFPQYGFDQENRVTNRIFIKNSCCNGSVLAHEIGHFLGLSSYT